MNENLQELKKKKERLLENNSYYKKKIKDYNSLKNRDYCPICDQRTKWDIYEKKIKELEPLLALNEKEIVEILKELDPLINEVRKKREAKSKERQQKIDTYIKDNKGKLAKAIRDYNKGIELYLPEINTKKERELWNSAMEKYMTEIRNMEENEELYFDDD